MLVRVGSMSRAPSLHHVLTVISGGRESGRGRREREGERWGGESGEERVWGGERERGGEEGGGEESRRERERWGRETSHDYHSAM